MPEPCSQTERGFQPAATAEGARGVERPGARVRVLVGCRTPLGCRCVAADKTVRAPGMGATTERGFQPAATAEGARGFERPRHARSGAGGVSDASRFTLFTVRSTL